MSLFLRVKISGGVVIMWLKKEIFFQMIDTLTNDPEVTFISNLALARFKIVSSINFIFQKWTFVQVSNS